MTRSLFLSIGNCRAAGRNVICRAFSTTSFSSSVSSTMTQSKALSKDEEEGEFRKLDLIKSKQGRFLKRPKKPRPPVPPPRFLKMKFDQDWASVWPTARTFHPASVPLPLHQGYVDKPATQQIPGKWGNLELMKIPNFLHLTPPAIKRHCEALKKFCTPWPEGLETEEDARYHFPIEMIYTDYCHSIPSIRDFRARVVSLKIKVPSLKFDEHALDKFRRLVGNRHDLKTNEVTIVTDNCPLRTQNYDYAMYLLTALYHESFRNEPWESEKGEEDWEKFIFGGSKSETRIVELLSKTDPTKEPKAIEGAIEDYQNSIVSLLNEGETPGAVKEYGSRVRELFGLPNSNA